MPLIILAAEHHPNHEHTSVTLVLYQCQGIILSQLF